MQEYYNCDPAHMAGVWVGRLQLQILGAGRTYRCGSSIF